MQTKSNLDKYQKLDKLGEGTYGVVYKAKNTETGEVSNSKSWRLRRINGAILRSEDKYTCVVAAIGAQAIPSR